MSAFSRVELELVQNEVSFDKIVEVLVKGCWIEENDLNATLTPNSIEFNGGFHDSYFKIILLFGQLIIESDSPWELEVLTEELKGIAVKKPSLVP